MASPYNVSLSRELVESGLVKSVKIEFNHGAAREPAAESGTACSAQEQDLLASPHGQEERSSRSSQSQRIVADDSQTYESLTPPDDPPYFFCAKKNLHGKSCHHFYVVTKGIQPGIYDCWRCAKADGKGEGPEAERRAPPAAKTACIGRAYEEAVLQWWATERAEGRIEQYEAMGEQRAFSLKGQTELTIKLE
ncbi:hypothetical protein PENSPDRAFT_695079 [Peniophora sp. CONT]|nr:hypothetical protein PENSPDRAFT_695079 [Peniophora sp. CONT]